MKSNDQRMIADAASQSEPTKDNIFAGKPKPQAPPPDPEAEEPARQPKSSGAPLMLFERRNRLV